MKTLAREACCKGFLRGLPKPHRRRQGVKNRMWQFDEEPSPSVNETALLSEAALAEDWNRPEEDTAWSSLQPEK